MNLEDIMLSDISQTWKAKHCMVSFIDGILGKKKSKKSLVVASGWVMGEIGIASKRVQIFSCKRTKV